MIEFRRAFSPPKFFMSSILSEDFYYLRRNINII